MTTPTLTPQDFQFGNQKAPPYGSANLDFLNNPNLNLNFSDFAVNSIPVAGNNPVPLRDGYSFLPNDVKPKTPFDWGGQGGANVMAGIQGLGGLAQALAAFKQYGVAKDTLAMNKDTFNTNLANQATLTNASIRDQVDQKARNAMSLRGETINADDLFNQRKVSGQAIS